MDAAALPEAACTIQGTVYQMARLAPGETYLVHGGAGGIGTFAIQIAKAEGCTVACTAGSPEKLARCRELGADLAISYRDDDFTAAVLDFTGGQRRRRHPRHHGRVRTWPGTSTRWPPGDAW